MVDWLAWTMLWMGWGVWLTGLCAKKKKVMSETSQSKNVLYGAKALPPGVSGYENFNFPGKKKDSVRSRKSKRAKDPPEGSESGEDEKKPTKPVARSVSGTVDYEEGKTKKKTETLNSVQPQQARSMAEESRQKLESVSPNTYQSVETDNRSNFKSMKTIQGDGAGLPPLEDVTRLGGNKVSKAPKTSVDYVSKAPKTVADSKVPKTMATLAPATLAPTKISANITKTSANIP